jgi:hypothetical protein
MSSDFLEEPERQTEMSSLAIVVLEGGGGGSVPRSQKSDRYTRATHYNLMAPSYLKPGYFLR